MLTDASKSSPRIEGWPIREGRGFVTPWIGPHVDASPRLCGALLYGWREMDFNRNQLFLVGLLLLLFGTQFRMVETFTLNQPTTRFLANRFQEPSDAPVQSMFVNSNVNIPGKVVKPPLWLGYSLISIGSVLVLHSIMLPKPAG